MYETIDQWCEWLLTNKNRSAKTVDKYRLSVTRLFNMLEERSSLSFDMDLAPLVEEFTGPVLFSMGLGAGSRAVHVAAIRGFFSWCERVGYLKKNPAKHLDYPDLGRRLPRVASMETAEKMLQQPDLSKFLGVRDAAIMSLLIGTGMRVSGLVGLNQEHLVWSNDEGKEELLVIIKEKGNRERLIPVVAEARLMLKAYLFHPELQPYDRLLKNGQRSLFITTRNYQVPEHERRGENLRLSREGVNDILMRHGHKAGLPKEQCHPHAFRHLFGTQLAEHDADIYQISDALGHATLETAKVYIHLAMQKKRALMNKASPLRNMTIPASGLVRELG